MKERAPKKQKFMDLEKKIDWFHLSRDIWIEILSWVKFLVNFGLIKLKKLSFEQRAPVRQVCKKLNQWITGVTKFWPMGKL